MKKIINFTFLLLFLLLLYEIILNNKLVTNSVIFSIDLFKNKLFPTLFPFFIISEFLINYGLANYLATILKYPFKFLFKSSSLGSFVFILSIISGFPSSAKYIKDLVDNKLIDELEATKLLLFTHFSNPLFILVFISNYIDFKYSIIILISHYITNIIIGIIFRNLYPSNNNSKIFIQKKFSYVFKNSIYNSINTLLLILGTVSFFMIIISIINNLDINIYLKIFLNSILEMTNGINYIGSLNITVIYKVIIITMILSFGGFSVHFQVLSILENIKIKYQLYLISRIIHSLISGILVYILFNLL